MSEGQRNLLILVAVAIVGVMFSSTFGAGVAITGFLLNTLMTIAIIAFAIILYRRNSGTIALMPRWPRIVLQAAALALFVILVTGLVRVAGLLPYPPFGWAGRYPVAFYGSLFALGFAIWWAWQQRTMRW